MLFDTIYIYLNYIGSFENIIFSIINFAIFFYLEFKIIKNYSEKFWDWRRSMKFLDIPINLKTEEVYRVEKDGLGPYHNDIKAISKHFKNKKSCKNTPSPYEEWGDLYYFIKHKKLFYKYKFAFFDKKNIYEWFTIEELKLLKENGFELNKYKAISFIPGKNQLMFDFTQSVLLERNIQY